MRVAGCKRESARARVRDRECARARESERMRERKKERERKRAKERGGGERERERKREKARESKREREREMTGEVCVCVCVRVCVHAWVRGLTCQAHRDQGVVGVAENGAHAATEIPSAASHRPPLPPSPRSVTGISVRDSKIAHGR